MKRISLVPGVLLLVFASLGASEKLKKEFEVGANPRLVIDADAANIEIKPGEAGRIVASVEISDRERYRLSSDQDQNAVHISLEHKGVLGWIFMPLDFATGEEAVIKVEVPANCSLSLTADAGKIDIRDISSSINAKTVAGEVQVQDTKGDVRADAGSGSVKVRNLTGTLNAQSGAGIVRVEDSKGEFYLESGAGSIDIYRSSGKFQVNSEVGSIDFEGSITDGDDNLFTTKVGSISVTLTKAEDIEIDAESDLGEVSISPEPESLKKGEHYLIARLGESKVKLRLRTDTGSITVRKGGGWVPVPEDEAKDEGDKKTD